MLAMTVEQLAPTIGAVIGGVDVQCADVGDVRAALLRHKVVWFRGQSLDAQALTTVAAAFGPLTEAHPVEPALEGHPEVLPLDSEEGARADVWHSDLTFQECPPMGALLHAVEIPAVGGDTLWSDTAAAYRSLSAPLRGFLDGLTAVHSAEKAGGYFAARDTTDGVAVEQTSAQISHHPVVRTHPETGERGLFVNPLFTDKIDGMRRRESDTLLALLYEAMTSTQHTVRWRWAAGDVAFWDNRCTMHYALLDFGSARRHMLRVALAGDRPRGQ
jgi:alpha-ketoglutarate-dependent taurine dioxygenase